MKSILICSFGLLLATNLMAQDSIHVAEVQTTLVTKRTATWCSICGGYAWDMMKRLQSNYDSTEAIAVSAHHSSSSRLYSEVAKAWIDAFQPAFSQPRFYVGTQVVGGGDPGTESTIENRIAADRDTDPLAGVGLQVAYEPETRSMRVRARMSFFRAAGAGNYRLGLYLLERQVVAEQANQSGASEHNNVLRESLTDQAFGTLLHQGAVTAGLEYDKELFYTLPEPYRIDNVRILAVIWSDQPEQIEVVNARATAQFAEFVATNTRDPHLPGTFRLWQNPVVDDIQVRLSPITALPTLTWRIVQADGRIWQSGHWSGLSPVEQDRHLSVANLPTGLYYLQLIAGARSQTLTFVKK